MEKFTSEWSFSFPSFNNTPSSEISEIIDTMIFLLSKLFEKLKKRKPNTK